MKAFLKKQLKSELFQEIISWILYGYLYIVSITSKKIYFFEDGFDLVKFYNPRNYVFILWHQQLALSTIFFKKIGKKICPLVSPHADGMILAKIIEKYGCKNIYGSSNKNATAAIREMITTLKNGGNLVVTPDGPRGPAEEINSNILEISNKYHGVIVPIRLHASRVFQLKTWDNMLIPLPFSKITIKFHSPILNEITKDTLKHVLDKR